MARREWAEQWVVHRRANPRRSEVPAYRYIATDGEYFIVEYCNQLKRLSKMDYELMTKGRA